MANSRNANLAAVPPLLAKSTTPLILLGDFNASLWSAPMRQLRHQTNLRPAAYGFGSKATWAYENNGLIQASIDHLLISSEWRVASYTVAGEIGSDHTPIVADLVLLKGQ
jgi:endonuclease/exonuclease/phosphatase (EEP) superfamily protein YafD